MIQVTLGVTDGSFSELVNGDLKVGDQLVSAVILPLSQQKANTNTGNPFAPNQGRPGMGGMTPGGGPGGGGGNPGGGGGGRAGGGGRGGGGN